MTFQSKDVNGAESLVLGINLDICLQSLSLTYQIFIWSPDVARISGLAVF